MKYLKTYIQLLEKKTKIQPFIKIFLTLPKSVDYRIIEWMIENWGSIFKRSPYGFSYYSAEKTWDYTKDKLLRLSDHWNFYSKATADKVHCKLDKPIENNEFWTIARYDKENGIYNEILSYPYNETKENRNKSLEILKKYKQEIGKDFDYTQLNKNSKMLKKYIENDDLYVKVLYYNLGEFVEELYGKVNRLKGQKLSFQDENDETQTFNHTSFTKSEMYFYDSDNKLIYHKKRNGKIN